MQGSATSCMAVAFHALINLIFFKGIFAHKNHLSIKLLRFKFLYICIRSSKKSEIYLHKIKRNTTMLIKLNINMEVLLLDNS